MSILTTAAKTVTDVVLSAGVGTVLTNAIKATTPATLSPYQKALVFVGSFAVSSMVSGAASTYAKTQFDSIAAAIKGEDTEAPKTDA